MLVYASMALMLIARFTDFGLIFSDSIGWIISGGLVLFVGLMIVFTWLAGDMRVPGDERESHRRDHAYRVAYNSLRPILAVLFIAFCYRGINQTAPPPPLPLRGLLVDLQTILLWAAVVLYFTLPQAILLWTEPDMENED